ncbi:hypothetical protein OFO12_03205 [Campylobacter sp. JMF_04 NA10]|uniref:hypothetical protein n=1 Tax=Campylobacter sp. JMF_04 NA10 TaxID=2983824 RepID=UPI0022E9BE3D|nr:hypothetical protein [Campylobacter sp. JMF_04 NA10]MDA3076376.1 hypothetical protein [Campylobacter sp. JMF_04 NA10]
MENKQPLFVINNNFQVITRNFGLLLFVDCVLVYIFLFLNPLWQTSSGSEILVGYFHNPKFLFLFFFVIFEHFKAIIYLIKKLKKPEKIYFYNDKIYDDKKDIYINLTDIKSVEKSIRPVIGKNLNLPMFIKIFPILVAVFLAIISEFVVFWIKIIFALNKNNKLCLYSNLVIISNKNVVINCYLLRKNDFFKIENFLKEKLNLEISNIRKTNKFYLVGK